MDGCFLKIRISVFLDLREGAGMIRECFDCLTY